MKCILGIMGILEFCDFVIFSNHDDTLIVQSCTLCFKNSENVLSHLLT